MNHDVFCKTSVKRLMFCIMRLLRTLPCYFYIETQYSEALKQKAASQQTIIMVLCLCMTHAPQPSQGHHAPTAYVIETPRTDTHIYVQKNLLQLTTWGKLHSNHYGSKPQKPSVVDGQGHGFIRKKCLTNSNQPLCHAVSRLYFKFTVL